MSDVTDSQPRIRDGMRAAPACAEPYSLRALLRRSRRCDGLRCLRGYRHVSDDLRRRRAVRLHLGAHAGGTIAAAILAAIFLNARYIAISVTVASIFPGGKLRRLAESQAIVDESWALAGRRGRFEWPILVGSGLVFYVLWVGSTAAGTAAGGILEDPNALGLDAAFAALFLALAVPYLRETRARQAAALAAVITLVLTPFTPVGVPIIAASAACLLGLRR